MHMAYCALDEWEPLHTLHTLQTVRPNTCIKLAFLGESHQISASPRNMSSISSDVCSQSSAWMAMGMLPASLGTTCSLCWCQSSSTTTGHKRHNYLGGTASRAVMLANPFCGSKQMAHAVQGLKSEASKPPAFRQYHCIAVMIKQGARMHAIRHYLGKA